MDTDYDDTDVVAYLQQVRIENDKLPKVFVAQTNTSNNISDTDEHMRESRTAKHFNQLKCIDDECQKLDGILSLSQKELSYFRHLKNHISSFYGVQRLRSESSLLNYAKSLISDPGILEHVDTVDGREPIWRCMFDTEPPPVFKLCQTGVHFGSVQECLHVISDVIAETLPDNSPSINLLKWLFTLLLLLDDLHAITETVSHELQRTRRALRRRSSLISEPTTTELKTELSSLDLISCIISAHFKQR